MKTVNGVYTSANIYTTNNSNTAIDDYAVKQIQMLCDLEAMSGCKIRVMPDVHPGKVGTIGFTSTIGNKIMPNLIGIDIGCGMTLAQIKAQKLEGQKLDTVIRDNVPSGFGIRKKPHHMTDTFDFSRLRCVKHVRTEKAVLSLGTLGGGNHFIEVDVDSDGNHYIVVHTGSRHLGKEVTEYYLNEGQKALKTHGINVPYELTWLEGELKDSYLHDLRVAQKFAELNREIIISELTKGMKWKILDMYSCHHNYIEDAEIPILRKGAISAHKDERVIIPINMRDGIILGTGLGNPEWNYSAPHGSGRIMKREAIKANFTVSSFKSEMKGIYCSCIDKDTLDEAPFAYRGIEEIAESIKDTVNIDKVIRPVYNFKAGGE